MPASEQQAPHSKQLPQRKGLAALALSCVSAAAAETATYPIDAVKTQLQLQVSSVRPGALGNSSTSWKSGNAARPAGAFQVAKQLVQAHGIAGLYAGLSPAVLRHFFYTGTRIALYEHLKVTYAAHQDQNQAGTVSEGSGAADALLLPKLLFGLTAGGVGQLVAVPADLIKVQMQADVRAAMSGAQQQRQFSSIRSVAAALVQQQGVAGLWRGGLPAVQRAALVNLGELSTYDSAKQAISQSGYVAPGLPTHLTASLCSGLVSALISTPADVIKTRLMAQAAGLQQPSAVPGHAAAGTGSSPAQHRQFSSSNSGNVTRSRPPPISPAAGLAAAPAAPAGVAQCWRPASGVRPLISCDWHQVRRHLTAGASGRQPCAAPQYNGMVDCAVQTVQREGLLALYKGFWPTWARLGPWQLVFWVTYEQLRGLAHLGAF